MYVKKNWEKTMICFISCYRNEIGFLIRFLCDLLSSGNAGAGGGGWGGEGLHLVSWLPTRHLQAKFAITHARGE